MEEWWHALDPENNRIVHIDKFARFLIEKQVITKAFEAVRMLKVSNGEKVEKDGFVTQSQYRRLVAKVCLRSSLLNIYTFLQKFAAREGLNETPQGFGKVTDAERISEKDKIDAMLHHLVKY